MLEPSVGLSQLSSVWSILAQIKAYGGNANLNSNQLIFEKIGVDAKKRLADVGTDKSHVTVKATTFRHCCSGCAITTAATSSKKCDRFVYGCRANSSAPMAALRRPAAAALMSPITSESERLAGGITPRL